MAKKTAKKTVRKKKEPDILSSGADEDAARTETVEAAQELMINLLGMKKNRVCNFRTMAQIRCHLLYTPNFMFQWLINSYGISSPRLIEIIGPEGSGKTTLALQLMAWFMRYSGSYGGILFETEGKPMSKNRIQRVFSSDPVEAERMQTQNHFARIHSLPELEEKLELWAQVMRGERSEKKGPAVKVPDHIPIVAVVDTWSKLLNKAEAAGFYAYGDNMDKDNKKKAVGEGSNMGHAQFAHGWARRLQYLQEKYNIQLILNRHQNDKVEMGAQAPSYISPEALAARNKTSIGGKALGQNAALQLIISHKKNVTDSSGTVISSRIRLNVEKNSYGPQGRHIDVDIRTDKFADTPGYQEPAVSFDFGMARFFADNKLLGTTVMAKAYSSRELGLMGASEKEFCDTFHGNKELWENTARAMHIEGFDRIIDDIKENTED